MSRTARRLGRHPATRIGVLTIIALGAAVAFLPGRIPGAGAACPATTRDAWAVYVLPLEAVRPADFVNVTWDVCGLPKGSATTTSVVLRPANARLAGRDARPSRTFYRDTIGGDAVRRTRRIKLPAVTPGDYLLSVAVRPDRGREHSASTPLRVEWRKP